VSLEKRFRGWGTRYVGRGFLPEEGISEARLAAAEGRLGFPLPESLRTYYQIAGGCEVLNDAHNHFYPPEGLAILEEHLLFMDENQSVVSWGFRLEDLQSPDPIVFQRNNTAPAEWYSEEQPFSVFKARSGCPEGLAQAEHPHPGPRGGSGTDVR
jgi:hypothetical protein